jgi:hypothetical protein
MLAAMSFSISSVGKPAAFRPPIALNNLACVTSSPAASGAKFPIAVLHPVVRLIKLRLLQLELLLLKLSREQLLLVYRALHLQEIPELLQWVWRGANACSGCERDMDGSTGIKRFLK